MSSFAALKSSRQARQKPLVSQNMPETSPRAETVPETSTSRQTVTLEPVDVDVAMYGLPDTVVVKKSPTRGRGVYVADKKLKKG